MKKKVHRGVWRFAILYTLVLLVMFSGTTLILLRALRKSAEQPPIAETEEVYVYLPQEEKEVR